MSPSRLLAALAACALVLALPMTAGAADPKRYKPYYKIFNRGNAKIPGHDTRWIPQGLTYWPEQDAPPDAAAWETSVGQVERDLRAMERLVADPKTDLFARIPHGTGQTVLREALVLADHNSYHLGQLVLLRRLLGAWKKD